VPERWLSFGQRPSPLCKGGGPSTARMVLTRGLVLDRGLIHRRLRLRDARPSCSSENPVAAKFCVECGAAGAMRRVRWWPKSTAGFSEGFDTADLKDAKALLDELGAN